MDLDDVERLVQVLLLRALGSIVASGIAKTGSGIDAVEPKACLLGAGIDLLGLAGFCLFI